MIELKYSLSGGSACWMFGISDKHAEAEINYWINQCSNEQLIVQGLFGYRVEKAVNRLLGLEGRQSVIDSRYTAAKLAKRFGVKFVSEVVRLSTRWVFQVDFLMQLNAACARNEGLELVDDNGDVIDKWTTQHEIEYCYPSDLVGAQIEGSINFNNMKNVVDNDWLIPTRWRHGCFDAIQIIPRGVRVVYLPHTHTHSLKMECVYELICALVQVGRRMEEVDVVVVVPHKQLSSFNTSSCIISEEHLLLD